MLLLVVINIVNSLPNNKNLDRSKLKAFADAKINVTEKLKSVWEAKETLWKKGENAGFQHFLLFPKLFSKGFLYRVIKRHDCVVKS